MTRHNMLFIYPLILILASPFVAGQDPAWRRSSSFDFRRLVAIDRSKPIPAIVVTTFLAHGALNEHGENIAVFDSREPVPFRIMQLGPGDVCRVAFQTTPGERLYQVYYGGPGTGQPKPEWNSDRGLLLETRSYTSTDLTNVSAVQKAFGQADSLGRDYVPNVFHAYNPIEPSPRPFFSHYAGTLQISRPGKYDFYTSSQDCSFLLVDGRPVVSAPGEHGPSRQARIKGMVNLTAGQHRFDYWHAAAGESATMVAAWTPPGATKPVVIPPAAFGSEKISHELNFRLQQRVRGIRPEFAVAVLGEMPLEEHNVTLVRAHLELRTSGKAPDEDLVRWDFGDGQTASGLAVDHVFLAPYQLYQVSMTVRKRPPVTITNRVWIGRPAVLLRKNERPDTLAQYAPILQQYQPDKLNSTHFLAWATALTKAGQHRLAAEATRQALQSPSFTPDDATRAALALQAAQSLSTSLQDPSAALDMLTSAASQIKTPRLRAACAITGAELALDEILLPDRATKLLANARDAAQQGILDESSAGKCYRLTGDWHARRGESNKAMEAYRQAEAARRLPQSTTERNARRGAYSRSVESFLREGQLDRAYEQLTQWLSDFPADKGEGYLSLLIAQHHAARGKLPQAVAVAHDLIAANPDSPYADRLLNGIAQWEEQLQHRDAAIAAYRSLIADYPGSPLVPRAKQQAERLSGK